MRAIGMGVGTVAFLVLCATVRGGPIQTFTDLDQFLAAAGDVHEIDFETLPNGIPSYPAEITPEFNYTLQGVTFSAHVPIGQPTLYLSGNPQMGFALTATSYPQFDRNWLIADLAVPATAIGVLFPGSTTLTGFDGEGRAVASISGGGGGAHPFVGIVSATPIVSTTVDGGAYSASIEAFFFTPVPEPGTLTLVALGLVGCLRVRPRRTRYSAPIQPCMMARDIRFSCAL